MDQVPLKSSRKGYQHNAGLKKYIVGGVVRHSFNEHEAIQIESDVFLSLCEAVNSPRALAAWLLYKNKEYIQLLALQMDPSKFFGGSYAFEGDLLVTKFFSKYADFNIDVDREELAFQKWLSAEKVCQATNDTFRTRWSGEVKFSHDVEEVIHLSRQTIKKVLGIVPPDILSHGGFGPGADLSTFKNNLSRYYKYQHSGSGTPALMEVVRDYVSDDRRDEFVETMSLTDSSRLTFVPKTALIDRAICVEPRWNIFYQLSIGRVIQSRLARFGVDITNQKRNRDLAGLAQKKGLATVDLSSASDMISKNLVLDLLPDDWSDLLCKTRCPYTTYKGTKFLLNKISSMGNGYTFPLETLIFYSLAKAASQLSLLSTEDVSVYGDDIIIPSGAHALLVEALNACGFEVNSSKTYVSGRFFESCGADYFDGRDVRPIFHKRRISNVQGAIRLANQIVGFARRGNRDRDFDSRFNAARLAILKRVPEPLRLLGPANAGDAFFHSTFDECSPSRSGNGWEGYRLLGFVSLPRLHDAREDSLIFAKLDGADAVGNNVTHRDDTFLAVRKIYVSRYEDYLFC